MIRAGDAARLPGTRIQNRCPIVSLGVDAIDQLMGGGLPLSNIYAINETNSRKYAPILQRYFIAEGLVSKQSVLVTDPFMNCDEFVNSLPGLLTSSNATTSQENEFSNKVEEEMKIAWRYKTMPTMNSALSTKDKTKFDLTKKLTVDRKHVETVNLRTYGNCWQHLYNVINSHRYKRGQGKEVLRILVLGVGSPLYSDTSACERFLRRLKALIQQANVVVMISVDQTVMTDNDAATVLAVADAYFHLNVQDTRAKDKIGLKEDYDGFFQILKLPNLNSFTTNKPECVDLVFEKHKHYFEIRILHLPVAVDDDKPKKTPCQSIQDEF